MSDASAEAEPAPVAKTHLGWSVVATVLCFLPLGLVAVYYGLRTASAVSDGRVDAAAHDSRQARRWLIVTVVIGLLIYLFLAAVLVLLGAFSH